MTRKKTWREKQIDSMRWDYGMYAEMWENEHDDRKIFSNVYYQIVEALESLPSDPPAWICVAVVDKLSNERDSIMDKILNKYRDGLWGEPKDFPLRTKLEKWPGILSSEVAV